MVRVTIGSALGLAAELGERSEPRPEVLTRRSCERRRWARLAPVDNSSQELGVSCHLLCKRQKSFAGSALVRRVIETLRSGAARNEVRDRNP